MSGVLIIIGLIILTVYPALNAVRAGSQRNLTDGNLQSLLRATAIYTQANGCLPCPTPAATTGAGFGRVRGDTATAPCGNCPATKAEGIPPFASLGIPASMARDGWGHWVTMRVDPALTVNFAVVPPTSACLASDPQPCLLGASQKGLCRAGLNNANRINVQIVGGAAQQAAVLFIAHGGNGSGAYNADALSGKLNGSRLPFPSSTPACAAAGYERCNADGDAQFVEAKLTLAKNNSYDDTLLYLDRNALVGFFGNATCQTSW
ncbi:MAG: hypothetical protein HGA90_02825 [Alphaproteobacteria bacterium]|nr:hypothetical protein [Alphaproteobacteria bacterium]